MAGQNDFLLRFRVDLTQAEQQLNSFAAKARSQIAAASSVTVPQLNLPPGLTSGSTLSASQAGAAFGATKQQFLTESAAAGLIPSATASALPAGIENQLNNAIIKALGLGNTLSGFKKGLSGAESKEFTQGSLAGATTVRKNIAEGEAVVNAKVQELIGIKSKEVDDAAKAAAAEKVAANSAALEAKGRKQAAEAAVKKAARLQEQAALESTPEFRAAQIAAAQVSGANQGIVAAIRKEERSRAKSATQAEIAATHDEAFYNQMARIDAQILVDKQKQYAATTVAGNRAVLGAPGLVSALGEAGATDQLLASAINAERARFFRNNPQDREFLVDNDFEQKREAAIQEGMLRQKLVADSEYIEGRTQSAAASKKEAALVSAGVAEKLALDTEYREATLQTIRAREIERLEILKGTTQEDIARRGQISALQTQEKERIRLAELEITSSKEAISLKAQRIVAERALNKALREQVAAELAANGDRFGSLAVRFGRGGLSGGGGGTDVGSAFGGGLFSSLTHILPTIALFGALAGLGASLKEFQELQKIFFQLDEQAEALGQTGSVGQLKETILDLARTSGTAAPEVASLGFQLQGAFGGDTQTTIRETTAAVEAVKVTGLSLAETTDSFTAITQSFKDQKVTIAGVTDTALGLQERFGVLAKETIEFAGSLAPVGAEIGFTADQLETLGAVAQKYSGRPGGQLSEAFGRILPSLQKNAIQVIQLFDQIGKKDIGDQLGAAFGSGQTGQAFNILLKNYKDLTQAQRNFVIEQLGGRREASALIPVLDHASEYFDSLSKSQDDAGKTSAYYAQIQETLGQKLAILGETLKQLGIKLFQGGLGEALTFLVNGLSGVFTILGSIIDVAAQVNETLGGIPVTILAIVAAMRGLNAMVNLATASFQRLTAAKAEDAVATEVNTAANSGNAVSQGARGAFAFGGIAGFKSNFAAGFAGKAQDIEQASRAKLVSQGWTELGAKQAVLSSEFTGLGKATTAVRSTFAGLVNSIPPGLAIAGAVVAVGALIQKFVEVKDSLEAANQSILQQVNTAPTTEERQRRIDQLRNADFGAVNTAFTFLTGNKTPEDLANELEQESKSPAQIKALEKLKKDIDFKDIKLNAALSNILGGQNNLTPTAGVNEIDELINQLKTSPGDTKAGDRARRALEEAKKVARESGQSSLADELDKLYNAAIGEAEATRLGAIKLSDEQQAAKDKLESTTQDLETIKSEISSGKIGIGQGLNKINAALVAYQQLQAGGNIGKEDAAKLQKLLEARDSLISNAALQQAEDVAKLRQATGDTVSPQETIDALIAALNSGKLIPSDRAKATDDLIKAYKDLYDFKTTQAQALGTEAEQLELLQNGVQIDPAAQAAIVEQQLRTADPLFQQFIQDQNEVVAEVLNNATGKIAELMIAEGLSVKEATRRVLEQRIELDNAKLSALKEANRPEFAGRIKELEEQIAGEQEALNDLGSTDLGTVDSPEKFVASGADQVKKAIEIQKKFADARLAYFKALNAGDSIATAQAELAAAQSELAQLPQGSLEWFQAATRVAQANDALRKAAKQRLSAKFSYLKAINADDPRAVAQIDLQEALSELASATPDEVDGARARVAQAQNAIKQSNQAYIQAQYSYYQQLYSDDPIRSAQIELEAANQALSAAKPGTEAYTQALSRVDAAQKRIRDAQIAYEDAQLSYAQALVAGDPVKTAQLAQSDAIRKFREARNDAERLKALGDKVKADQEFVKAQRAILDAQSDYIQAIANFKGDSVGGAEEALQVARRHLQEVISDRDRGQAGDADVIKAQTDVINAQAQLRDSKLQKSLDEYSFLFDMGKITQAQYIAYLQKLKALPDLTQEQLRSIDRQIKSLQDQLNQDLQFNIPNEIKLPVLYEARRLNQSGSGGYGERGSIGYQDNRIVTIQIDVKDGMDKNQVIEVVNDAVGSNNRFSRGIRRY